MDKRNDLDESTASRAITDAINREQKGEPQPPHLREGAVYGDTDMTPNERDQKTAHHADDDEHL